MLNVPLHHLVHREGRSPHAAPQLLHPQRLVSVLDQCSQEFVLDRGQVDELAPHRIWLFSPAVRYKVAQAENARITAEVIETRVSVRAVSLRSAAGQKALIEEARSIALEAVRTTEAI